MSDPHPPACYHFRDAVVDAGAHSLRRCGVDVHLRPKSIQVLLYLLANRHRLVTKEELLRAVWPDASVTEDTLVHSIVELRKALGDDAHHPWLIETVTKSGYRFVADVRQGPCTEAAPPRQGENGADARAFSRGAGVGRGTRAKPMLWPLVVAGSALAGALFAAAGLRWTRRRHSKTSEQD